MMTILDYYGLQEQPFGNTSDSRYVYLSPNQKQALASLIYGIEAGCGFVALIATPGLGKTTLLYEMLQALRDKARLVFLFQSIRTPWDLLRALLSGLGVRDLQGSLFEMQLKLNDLLREQHRQGKRVVVLIDEAQNLDDSVLELVRMLSNYETGGKRLIQIILSGQPQLATNMGSPQLLQLRQRISIFASLKPFSTEETALYTEYRLQVAGCRPDTRVFTKDALLLIAQSSDGIPRNINNLCFSALSLGFALQRRPIDRDIVSSVVGGFQLAPGPTPNSDGQQTAPSQGTLKLYELASPPDKPARRGGWLRSTTVAAIVILTVCGALFASHRWLAMAASPELAQAAVAQPVTETSVQATEMVSRLASAAAALRVSSDPSSPDLSSQAIDQAFGASSGSDTDQIQSPVSASTVLVAPGQTLVGICIAAFADCTPEILRRIQELNPSLNDPDHIETGQIIRVPALAARLSDLKTSRASSEEKGTHDQAVLNRKTVQTF